MVHSHSYSPRLRRTWPGCRKRLRRGARHVQIQLPGHRPVLCLRFQHGLGLKPTIGRRLLRRDARRGRPAPVPALRAAFEEEALPGSGPRPAAIPRRILRAGAGIRGIRISPECIRGRHGLGDQAISTADGALQRARPCHRIQRKQLNLVFGLAEGRAREGFASIGVLEDDVLAHNGVPSLVILESILPEKLFWHRHAMHFERETVLE
mmetsp:Transcript_69966/g.186434  ORF Transcript_69966/g.186434 Transcript_69966/m.186434 type:complete len:208 (-) Transcript_69966:2292-2915(-)